MFKLVIEGVKDGIEEKLKSPLWGTMIFTWLTWNWEIWYLTIFVSEERVGNKIEYIANMYTYSPGDFTFFGININGIEFYSFIGFIFNWIIMPLLLSGILIWWVSKLSDIFLSKYQKNKEREALIAIKDKKTENKKDLVEIEKLKNENKIMKLQFKRELEIKEHEIKDRNLEKNNKYLSWDDEYDTIIQKYEKLTKDLNDLIYFMYGFTRCYINGRWYDFNSQTEGILNTFELIEKNNEKGDSNKEGNHYNITEKGRYFLKKATLENQI